MAVTGGSKWSARGRALAIGAVLAAGAGCAQEGRVDFESESESESVEFEASPEFLGQAIDASEDAAYRFSMAVTLHVNGQDLGGDLATGVVDGDEFQNRLDMGVLIADLPDDEGVAELTVTDDAFYVHQPFAAALAADPTSNVPHDGGIFEALADLGDDWGRIEVDGLGDVTVAEMDDALNGAHNGDPRALLDGLRDVDEVEDIGTREIDGTEVSGLAGQVDLQTILRVAALGSAVGDILGQPVDVSSFDFPLEVWIGDDGLIRQIHFGFDFDALAGLAEINDVAVPDELEDYGIDLTVDFTDHGDPSIAVETPRESRDVTDEFVAAYEVQQELDAESDDEVAEPAPTTTTRPAAPVVPFFATDFTTGDAWGPLDPPFFYRNGKFVIAADGNVSGGTLYGPSPPFPATGDITVDVDVQKAERGGPSPDAVFGVECGRDPGAGDYSAYRAIVAPDRSWKLVRLTGSSSITEDELAAGTSDAISPSEPNHVTLSIVARGRTVTLTLSVGGQEVGSAEDPDGFGCQFVGLFADPTLDGSTYEAHFDNLVVVTAR